MLSRFTRMSSLGAHLVSGCTALKDTPTAPKPVAQLGSSGRSGSFIASKENSPGCLPEPFLWHDHDNFLAELSELDHWKNDLTPSTSRTSPERQSSTLDDSAEWSSILHSIEWIDKFEALDIPKVDSECSSSDYPESSSRDDSCDFVEKTASLVDWKAWNCYLGMDDDFNFNLDLKTEDNSTAVERSQCEESQATPPDVKVKTENDIEEKKDPPYLCELRTGSDALVS
ncbi:BZIP domain-containing protein [Trichostrongylus colubriformis]|uniref:BZIP domain-containing protein n=1 Tax=Trichostrongylus colubriformis TaxID=6319 RepID=A0AAN8J3Q6_TRICO